MRKLWIAAIFVFTMSAQQSPRDAEHTAWIASTLRSMDAIKVGMTRRDLLGAFTVEGGISYRLHRTYVYKQCPYIKVDVDFTPVGNPNDGREQPEDKIAKLSRPYLQWAQLD